MTHDRVAMVEGPQESTLCNYVERKLCRRMKGHDGAHDLADDTTTDLYRTALERIRDYPKGWDYPNAPSVKEFVMEVLGEK